ncbi:O-methyltransferase [Chitinophaga costaii]|uniref:O-methyltransferase n=1 Tax=Chitinophaga costaii TaxID=1335309 RepID=UPI001F0C073F|nr:class I SAM-dependent methyltransferase [Chitinophaga costaii]
MNRKDQWQLAKKYLRYRFGAGNRHSVHSPFVYAIADKLLRDHKPQAAFRQIEGLRKSLLSSKETVTVTDLGAGSQVAGGNVRRISDITKYAAKPAKFGQFFYRAVAYFQPKYLLELGTSMGLSTAYMASANPAATVITIEGCPNITQKAKENFARLGLQNIRQVTGNFDTVLPEVLDTIPSLDWVFIDGNHRAAPTMAYFEACLPKVHDDTVLIFDDIHWTADMEKAWDYIKSHPQVTTTIDLFFIGLVFFKKDMKARQHYVLKY